MAKPKRVYTVDEEMFAWIESEKTLKGPGRPSEAARKRQRYLRIRNVARKEIADLTKLAKTLSEHQREQIFNVDYFTGLTGTLFTWPGIERANPELKKAEIAELFIQAGFSYLSSMKRDHMTLSHKRTLEEAIDLSRYLLDSFRPERDRGHIRGF